jgi:hypothetical protein
MGLLDDLTPPVKIWPCQVQKVAESLDPKDAEILLAAVVNPEWKYQALEMALRDKGISLGQTGIKRHRLRTCSCGRVN